MPYGSRLWRDVPATERGLEPLPAAVVEVLRPCDWLWMPRPDDPMVGWMAEDPFSHKDSIAPAPALPPPRCKKLRRWLPYRKQQAPDPVDLAIDATEHNTAAPTPEIAIPGAATIASEAPESRRQAFLPGSDSGECRNEELLLFYYRTIAACDRLRIEGGLSRALTSADAFLPMGFRLAISSDLRLAALAQGHASAGHWHRRNGAILTIEGVSIPRRQSVGWQHQLKPAPESLSGG
ncbi:hypothetical protein H0G86_005736 [Trichoderma simmonsii]|uniref:Uncharacterized protein n=1 Tax=Trichoderma simmonsii TaxID=1491479 RepID=A0A8G0LA50_9HYPO|nr:hypothetical protein H0G86_005736 [Trichoderma simmonsii]